ncbi:MAG: ATP-dependent acyl-CoA ligase [Rhizobacter sp.]|nr:ATP-dependent acyl-CoA ligase [Rhizobacter sp.]
MKDTTALSVHEAFAATAQRRPEAEFLAIPASASAAYAPGGLSFSYGEARREIDALRQAYAQAGLAPGARVATLLENRPAAFFHWIALNSLGVSAVPINPDYREAELRFLLEHSESCLVVGIAERLSDLRAVAGSLEHRPPVVDAAEVRQGIAPVAFQRSGQPITRDTECALLYTSGTTGRPKGCMLSNDYFLRLGLRYANRGGAIGLRDDCERVLTPLPMFHMNAMATSTVGMILRGGCVIQLDRFHPKTWWSDVAGTRATGVHYLGVMPAILLGLPETPDERSHSVRYGTGANVEPKHHAAFERRFGFPLIESWAMTETGSGAGIGTDEEPRHLGTRCFGKVPSTVELRLVDDDGLDVPDGEPGEMWVRRAGPEPRLGFFSGYLKDEAATQAGWAGGWWHTGDMARKGADGSLHFVDRKKNVIRRSGENISALDVEEVLRGCPAIQDVAVTSVADELRGDEVFAFIVPAAEGAGEARAGDIVDWMLARAAYYKAPGWIAFVERIPTTATQKIERGSLKRMAAEAVVEQTCFDTRGRKRRTEPAAR